MIACEFCVGEKNRRKNIEGYVTRYYRSEGINVTTPLDKGQTTAHVYINL